MLKWVTAWARPAPAGAALRSHGRSSSSPCRRHLGAAKAWRGAGPRSKRGPALARLTPAGAPASSLAPSQPGSYLTTIAATQQELIVIDLRQLTFLDATGVAALVAADRHARGDGRSLAIVKGPPQVQRVLDICGLTEVLALADEPLGADGEEA
jgi:anti-anti-sigma factor